MILPVVLTSGCFDGVHAGHVRYLQAAKALCVDNDVLVCAVAPDSAILAKGRTPRWSHAERLETVSALQDVDAAIAQRAPSVASLIRQHRPRMFVKGPDWKDRLPEDVYLACNDVGTAIAFVETPGRHVSETIDTHADALARFEAIAMAQPAPTLWTPVTPYDFTSRRIAEGPHAALIWAHLVPYHDSDILDYGCGPEAHLVRLLSEHRRDNDPQSLAHVAGYDPQSRNLHWRSEPHGSQVYDLVICREVLEHCRMPELHRIVSKICALSARFVYVTTRFAKAADNLLSVDTSDDLDPTHITMLHPILLRSMFVLEGFKRRADLEAIMDHRKLGRVLVYERAS